MLFFFPVYPVLKRCKITLQDRRESRCTWRLLSYSFLSALLSAMYFLRAMRKEKQGSPSGRNESSREMEKIRQLRQIHLNQPLGEQVRPRSFSDIIGQEEGIRALCAILCGPNPQHVILYGQSRHRQDLCGKIGVGICKKTAGFCFSCRCTVCRNGRHLCSF